MRNFKFGNRSRDRNDFPRRDFGGRDSRRPSMHDAVCDDCGRDCQVPFRPSGEKPVYCNDCFDKKGGRDSNRPMRRDSRRRSYGGRDSGKSPQSNINDRSISKLTEKIEILNAKLEKIINLLTSTGAGEPTSAEDATKKNKKSISTKTEEVTEVLPPVADEGTDLISDKPQEKAKSKPKKKAKSKVDTRSETKSKVAEKSQPVDESKAKGKITPADTAGPDNESSGDQSTEEKEESPKETKLE